MKIECILKRKGGTVAEIGGIEYHFKPQEGGAHVADVKDNAHIQRFLSIPEGYRIYGEPANQVLQDQEDDDDEQDDEQEDEQEDEQDEGQEDEDVERDHLAAQYEARFGKKPNGRMSAETIRQKLAE